ncbi:MAG: fumarate hydratase [Eubacteriaceae bacterium]|nr:fumarate hydratase [Eubacteriaceae bacterium]MDD4507702.1 fumarate hydratase [Eubacteriaceae bacterium]
MIIQTKEITNKVAQNLIEMNASLSDDMNYMINYANQLEKSETAKNVFKAIQENMRIANKKNRPICQDTGMVVAFVTMGQDVQIQGGGIEEAIQNGVHKGYLEGYLRKSVVDDPIIRNNTEDNTPAVIHYRVVKGDYLKIDLMAKGFGSENTSALKMLKPSDGIEGVKRFILDTIEKGAPNACAPIVIGIGIGGTFEKSALMAKEALLKPLYWHNEKKHFMKLEQELLQEANNMGIGPMGMGGSNTVLGVNILDYPTHIAGLPVAVNICCYVNRHRKVIFSD